MATNNPRKRMSLGEVSVSFKRSLTGGTWTRDLGRDIGRSWMTTSTDEGVKTVIGACPHDCPDTCSMMITVKEGRAIGVRGNPEHPFTCGRLCAKTNDFHEKVHSPERVMYPLKRKGPKGSGEFRADKLGRGPRRDQGSLEWHCGRVWPDRRLALQLPRYGGHTQRPERGGRFLQQVRRHHHRMDLLRFRFLHRLHHDRRADGRGRS